MEKYVRLELLLEVEKLNDNTPDGYIVDADTILADITEASVNDEGMRFTGVVQDIFNIWKQSTDKKSVEMMFYEFTDMEFEEYLIKCKEEITREVN